MIESLFLEEAVREMARLKDAADKALAQAGDDGFFWQMDPESNSIAVIVKHLAGTLKSRWTDFLRSDGEKPDRDRDGEFVLEEPDDRDSLMRKWDEAWNTSFSSLKALQPPDVEKEVLIRGQAHTVLRVITLQVSHTAYHVGQIAFLAKHLAGEHWQSLSVPRNKARVTSRRTSLPR